MFNKFTNSLKENGFGLVEKNVLAPLRNVMEHAQSASLLAGQANAERTTKGIDHVGKNVSATTSNATIHAQKDSLPVGQVNA